MVKKITLIYLFFFQIFFGLCAVAQNPQESSDYLTSDIEVTLPLNTILPDLSEISGQKLKPGSEITAEGFESEKITENANLLQLALQLVAADKKAQIFDVEPDKAGHPTVAAKLSFKELRTWFADKHRRDHLKLVLIRGGTILSGTSLTIYLSQGSSLATVIAGGLTAGAMSAGLSIYGVHYGKWLVNNSRILDFLGAKEGTSVRYFLNHGLSQSKFTATEFPYMFLMNLSLVLSGGAPRPYLFPAIVGSLTQGPAEIGGGIVHNLTMKDLHQLPPEERRAAREKSEKRMLTIQVIASVIEVSSSCLYMLAAKNGGPAELISKAGFAVLGVYGWGVYINAIVRERAYLKRVSLGPIAEKPGFWVNPLYYGSIYKLGWPDEEKNGSRASCGQILNEGLGSH